MKVTLHKKEYMKKYRVKNKREIAANKKSYRENHIEKSKADDQRAVEKNHKFIELSKNMKIHMTKWSDEDIQYLLDQRQLDINHDVIAAKLNRSIKACKCIMYNRKRKTFEEEWYYYEPC